MASAKSRRTALVPSGLGTGNRRAIKPMLSMLPMLPDHPIKSNRAGTPGGLGAEGLSL